MAKPRLAVAEGCLREAIYAARHDVYAVELGQHAVRDAGSLSDALDERNVYLAATDGDTLLGFVSLTPPDGGAYSIDKYFDRATLPFTIDRGLWEVRLLTVPAGRRGGLLATALMYAALRWAETHGGTRIVGIGRRELHDLYARVGLLHLGPTTQAGSVCYELMSATVEHLRSVAAGHGSVLSRLSETFDWALPVPFADDGACFHGGAFFTAIGESFDRLDRRREVINADVLDAWFDPSPRALRALADHLPWLLRTSPPLAAPGLVEAIAGARELPSEALCLGAGSSSLIYLAFRAWLSRDSRVLLPEPTYGEYAHVLEQVIGCRVDRLATAPADGFALSLEPLRAQLLAGEYDLAVLVNPNNPTGQLLPREQLEPLLADLPARTRVWVDEAYIDYAGRADSLEPVAAASRNVFVCKSLSKVYALSGARAAYLVGPAAEMALLRRLTPPWAISLPAQVAAVAALAEPDYYRARYAETAALRDALAGQLRAAVCGLRVVDGVANYLLCELPEAMPEAALVIERCRLRDVWLRPLLARPMAKAAPEQRWLRVAVKSAADNERIVAALSDAVRTDWPG